MKIGVFVCHCGSNIEATVDTAEVARIALTYPDVAHAEDSMYTCSEPGQDNIVDAIKKYGLDGVVVASCSPRMHEQTFRRTVEALQDGDPVIVFPDVDYTDRSGDMGEIYDGFLLIDRFWQRVSDTPLDFVPLRLDRKARRIAAGEAVRFDRTAPRQGETVRVREALLRGLNGEI